MTMKKVATPSKPKQMSYLVASKNFDYDDQRYSEQEGYGSILHAFTSHGEALKMYQTLTISQIRRLDLDEYYAIEQLDSDHIRALLQIPKILAKVAGEGVSTDELKLKLLLQTKDFQPFEELFKRGELIFEDLTDQEILKVAAILPLDFYEVIPVEVTDTISSREVKTLANREERI